jgi:ABC-type transport system substrate-binding protein
MPVALLAAVASLLAVLALAAPAAHAAPPKQLLVVNLGTMPGSLDPGLATYEEDLIYANAVFAPLYRSPGGNDGRLMPFLAAAQPVVSLGGRRYVVQLRAARWSDGQPILARDVVFAFNRARKSSRYGADFTQVRRVEAIGPRTVRFELREPVPWFAELLASPVTTPVPAHAVRRHDVRWTRLDRIVTSGPFRPVSGRGHTELVLERNPRWWGARSVRLQRIELLAVTQAAGTPLFRGRRLDVGLRDTSVHPTALSSWAQDPRLKVVPTGSAHYLHLNTRRPRLAEPAVRRAIALAIDRNAITAITGPGLHRPLQSTVPPGVRSFPTVAPAGERLLRQDGLARVAEAQAQLDAGGFVPGAAFNLYYASDTTFGARVAGSIRTSLAAAGVTVTIHGLPTSSLRKVGVGLSPVGDAVDMVLAGQAPDFSDPHPFHQPLGCDAIDAGTNTSNFCAEDFDALLATARTSVGAARAAAHRDAERLLTGPEGLMPAVPLYAPVGTLLVQPWVRGFRQHPSGRVDFERIWIAAS